MAILLTSEGEDWLPALLGEWHYLAGTSISALLVVFSFWFWRLLEKRVIQKTLGRCLDEIWTHRFSFILICGLVSRMKALDYSVDRSCSLFPSVKFKVRLVQMVWSWRDRRKYLLDSMRERESGIVFRNVLRFQSQQDGFDFETLQMNCILVSISFKILKSKLLSSRTFSIAAGPFLQSWRP